MVKILMYKQRNWIEASSNVTWLPKGKALLIAEAFDSQASGHLKLEIMSFRRKWAPVLILQISKSLIICSWGLPPNPFYPRSPGSYTVWKNGGSAYSHIWASEQTRGTHNFISLTDPSFWLPHREPLDSRVWYCPAGIACPLLVLNPHGSTI